MSGSVAAFHNGELLREISLPSDERSAQSLAPTMQLLLGELGWKPRDVRLCGVTSGPGSFTGLRVGVVTAKTWAYVTGCDLIGVNTLEVIAARAANTISQEVETAPSPSNILAILDAGREQFFAADFQLSNDGVGMPLGETKLVRHDEWIAGVSRRREPILVTGPGLSLVGDRLPPNVTVAPEAIWRPDASTVGRLTWRKYAAGVRDDFWALVPLYLRQSAAEEKLARGLLKSEAPKI